MSDDQRCGNCVYGAPAYHFNGLLDHNYVICKVRELQNLGRKPNPHETLSTVSRMHQRREACLHWEEIPRSQPPPPPLPEPELELPVYQPPSAQPTVVESSRNKELEKTEVDSLKKQLLQQDQMLTSLRHENVFLHEQLQQMREEIAQLKHKSNHASPGFPDPKDYFSLLGVAPHHTSDDIKDAYRNRMKLFHPDRFIALAQQLNVAYETLLDPQKRQDYLRTYRQR